MLITVSILTQNLIQDSVSPQNRGAFMAHLGISWLFLHVLQNCFALKLCERLQQSLEGCYVDRKTWISPTAAIFSFMILMGFCLFLIATDFFVVVRIAL